MNERTQTFIIAEAGVNHNGSIDMAIELVDAAARAGADAVKFQTFKADQLLSQDTPKADYQLAATSANESQYEMIKKLELSDEAHYKISTYCTEKGIHFMSTAFDIKSIEFLMQHFDMPFLKIPSGEITNAPYLLHTTRVRKPILLSTGMSSLSDIERALGVLAFGYLSQMEEPCLQSFEEAYFSDDGQEMLKKNVTLLHCTTEYPAPLNDVHLLAMDTLKTSFGLPVGYSDHTAGIAIPIAAAARGASVIEKHFTLSRELPGPDHKASLEPNELSEMVSSIRQVERALGGTRKQVTSSERKNKSVARKSIVAATEIRQGDVYSSHNLTVKRPGDGISPMHYWELAGRKANRDYRKDELIEW